MGPTRLTRPPASTPAHLCPPGAPRPALSSPSRLRSRCCLSLWRQDRRGHDIQQNGPSPSSSWWLASANATQGGPGVKLRMQRGGQSWDLRSADVRLVCLEQVSPHLHQKPVCLGSGVSLRLGQGSSLYPAVEVSL